MRRLDRALLLHLLPRLLKCACGETVHRSGEEGARTNCFVVAMPKGKDPDFVLLSIAGDAIKALQFDGSRYAIDTTVVLDDIDPATIEVTHYFGLDEIRYQGIWAVARGRTTRIPYVQIHLQRWNDRLAQRVFNRRTLTTRRRLAVLREVAELVLDGNSPVDAMDLMSGRYGARWAGHPDWRMHHQALEFQLDLLAESGELTKIDYKYRPTGLALKTLEDSEEQDRKHSANLRVQLLLAVLALLALVMAAAQAGLIKLPTLIDFTEKKANATLVDAPPVTGSSARSASTMSSSVVGALVGASAVPKDSALPLSPAPKSPIGAMDTNARAQPTHGPTPVAPIRASSK